MKKVLSLVLAFAMILGSFGFVFASNFPDVKDTEYYGEAVNVLSGFGVIAGFPDGTFKPTENVTRAQMAAMITAALAIPVKGSGSTGFSDVPVSHWASGYIAYAVSVGFVAGYPDKTFKPENPVSYNEALTMIVASLGYSAESLPGAWPGAFINKAQGLGILDTCKTTGNAPAPRQDIACFLYDALTAQIGYVDKDGEWHPNVDKNGDPNDSMIVRLGAVDYNGGNGAGEPFVVEGDEESLINLDEYFGAYITAYASKDDKGTIVAIKEVMSEFIEGKVNTGKTTIKGDSEYKITSSTKQMDPDFRYFLNGEVASQDYDSVTGKTMKFAVKLSGNKIAEVYSAQEWTAAGTFRADEDIQEELEDDMTLNGGTYTFAKEDDEIDESAFIMVGKAALADLAEDDVITVYLDGVTSGDIAKLEVSTDTVEGAITKINKAGDEYTIAGTAYDVAADAKADAKGLQPDDEGTFYLNYAGEVFDFEATKDTTKNFAVVLDMGKDTGRYSTADFYLKMFLADGTEAEFACSEDDLTTFIVSKAWTGLTAGDVVEYEIDSDNVVVGLVKQNAKNLTIAGEFDKNGIADGAVVTSKTVIFSYTGGTESGAEKKASNYSVLTVDDIKSAKYTTLVGGVDNGDFTAIKVTGVEESSDVYAIFVSEDGKNADGKLWTVLYDGDVKEMTVDKAKAPTTYTTGSGATLYTLSFDGDLVKTVTTASAIKVTEINAPASKLEVNGSTFKIGSTNYSVDPEAAVYVYDESDEEWTKGKLGNVKYNYICLIGTGSATDEVYDIVLLFKD